MFFSEKFTYLNYSVRSPLAFPGFPDLARRLDRVTPPISENPNRSFFNTINTIRLVTKTADDHQSDPGTEDTNVQAHRFRNLIEETSAPRRITSPVATSAGFLLCPVPVAASP